MSKPTIEYIESPNSSARRGDKKITAIVLHYTGSLSIEGTISWFQNEDSKVSAHYVVGRDGRVVQMVRDQLKAWHAGPSAMRPDLPATNPKHEKDVNNFSLGIELVATPDSGFTDRQLASLYSLLEILVTKYRIDPDRVVGHSKIAPGRKIDPEGFPPGQFNWAKVNQVAVLAYNSLNGVTPAVAECQPAKIDHA